MGRRKKQTRVSRTKKWFNSKKRINRLVVVFIGIILFGLLVFSVLISFSDVSKLDIVEPRPTFIYDINGEVASKVSNSKIEGVSLDQIPTELIEAFVATEDQHFYKHNGINYFGITKAFMQNLVKGKVVAGGSTITQQLSKNVFLTTERTYTRKFKELIFTKKIERKYSKDEIMERYLNQIYFGEGAWGIQRAAHVYFGKDVSELSLNESATLAGLIKAPSNLSPYKSMEKAVERRNIVLSLMKSEGYINQKDFEETIDQPIALTDKETIDYKGKYPYYVDYLIEEAVNKYGLTENEVLSGGLHIYTELNPVIQDATEEVYRNENNFPVSKPDQLIQSGSVFLNPKTGGISALVGGRGDYTYKRFNNATKLVRQPGSALKPLAVYTAALEQGYDFGDMLVDEPINIDGYQPQNIDKRYRGQVTLYDALLNSYNIPAVWLLNKIGIEEGFSAVERFGIPLEKEDHNLGLALGGLHQGTSPLLMAQAFSAFPNDGIMMQAHAISEIKDAGGKVVGSWSEKSARVTEPEVAQKMTFMLKGVVDDGTARIAQIPGIDVAGKTGTTQLPFTGVAGSKDHWFVGYTPELVGAIWLGYDKTDQEHYLTATSGVTVTTIFQQIVTKSMSELPTKDFDLSLVEKKKQKPSKKINNGQKKDQENKKDKEDKKDKRKDREKEKKKDKEDKKDKGKDREKENKKDKEDKRDKEKNRDENKDKDKDKKDKDD
ncbi:PBP1A family penicillin-binding protein [Sporosarcina sp. E16_8]|uniref:transglycosylase domain-containing protein n=1 Tax=Sporosarcina sp. E16_8 TaxID=2789295 RepID=UPI001A912D7F|nr:PBP1A family penicillin-binding protein [Sporosarcina sp. E16_8]MBO0589437.1 PBP1A family penicillin-binding protein [Sporosarcina sp. E16_8]